MSYLLAFGGGTSARHGTSTLPSSGHDRHDASTDFRSPVRVEPTDGARRCGCSCGEAPDSLATDSPPPIKESTVRTLITIALVGLLVIGAIALGVKFFSTSVREEEDEKGWDE